jgi:peptidoglycan/LPS O-acetylase OafA/YrhL
MFAVIALFSVFIHAGKPLQAVPVLFVASIVLTGIVGWVTAVAFAEPVNLLIRRRAGLGGSATGMVQPQVD